LLRVIYTRPILRAAGLEKQNIQMVIINESAFNAFVADGRRIFVNYGRDDAVGNVRTRSSGCWRTETGHLAGGHLSKLRETIGAGADADDHRHAARGRRAGGGLTVRQRQLVVLANVGGGGGPQPRRK